MNLDPSNIIKELFVYSPERPILYTQPVFWILFASILGFYSFFYKRTSLRNIYLLIVSYFLYYKTNGSFVALLIFSCGFNYFAGVRIGKWQGSKKAKTWLIFAIGVNLFILGYFKYAYFFTESFNALFRTRYEYVNWLLLLENKAFGSSFNVSSVLLPVGISFYTFQAISYLVDVYRRRIGTVKNILDFSFYLSFFPQVVSGPIVRASVFIPQLYQKYTLTKAEFGHAVFLILKGLIKKIVFADFIAANFTDRILDSPISYTGIENILSVYGYSLQIYADFSGYTDIAIGVALILGFKLPVNFNEPYKAANLSDFWHRWHISLSLWLRDYLYIPLGGNRKGKFRNYLNLMATMLLGGLWHGANLRFIVWGTIHGIGLVLEKFRQSVIKMPGKNSRILKTLGIVLTFHIVTFAWIFFRIENTETLSQFFYQVRFNFKLPAFIEIIRGYTLPLSLIGVGFSLIYIPYSVKEKIRGWFIKSPAWLKLIIVVCSVLLLFQAASSGLQSFIYFQF